MTAENPNTKITSTNETPNPEAWAAIQGGYDLQVHVAPDVIARRIDDLDLARDFLARGLKGFVLKSHYFPTAERAQVVCKAVPGIRAMGAITLNHAVGGLNPVALELAGRSGCKIVWMPTVDAANETAGRPDGTKKHLPFWANIQLELAATGISPAPITVLDEAGKLTNQARTCLELISKHNMILATGHLGRREILALVQTAKEIGLRRVMVTHAEFPSQNLTAAEQVELAGRLSDEAVVEAYNRCRAVVYAPVDEDYGYATVEAFTAGKPVLTATDAGAVREFVTDGVTGAVVPPEPAAFAAVLDRWYHAADEARRVGLAGRETVKDIRWDTVVRALTGSE